MMLLSMGASSLLLRTEKENEINVSIVIAITLYEERRMTQCQSRYHGPRNFLDNDIAFKGEEPWEKGDEPVERFADGYRPKKKRVKSEELSRKRKQFPTEACSLCGESASIVHPRQLQSWTKVLGHF